MSLPTSASTKPQKASKIPLAATLRNVNSQLQSPLYDGRLPGEIRDLIFELAMTDCFPAGPFSYNKYSDSNWNDIYSYPKSSRSRGQLLDRQVEARTRREPWPTDTHYTRPGYTANKVVSISLLLVCKRAYLEAHHLPFQQKEHVFWHDRSPFEDSQFNNELAYFRRFRPEQLQRVKGIHIFAQQFWLESYLHLLCCNLNAMLKVERLTLTLRRGDWWFWEQNAPLSIRPHVNYSQHDPQAMKRDWAAVEPVTWQDRSWGLSFAELEGLRELVIEFEVSKDKQRELEAIVERARKWRFPMKDRRVLSAEGQEVVSSAWRGPPVMLAQCSNCVTPPRFGCISCEELFRLRRENMGPELVVMKLKWKVVALGTDM